MKPYYNDKFSNYLVESASQFFDRYGKMYGGNVEAEQIDETIRNPERRKKLQAIADREVRKGDKSKGESPRSKYHTEKGKRAISLLVKSDNLGSKIRKRGGEMPAEPGIPTKGKYGRSHKDYWGTDPNRDRGRGNKAARRMGKDVPNRGGREKYEESLEIYDVVLQYILDEGYAVSFQDAFGIMADLDEDTICDILEEVGYEYLD